MRSISALLLIAVIGGTWVVAQAQPGDNGYRSAQTIYAALGHPDTTMNIGGGTINVTFADGAPGLDRGKVLTWVRDSAVAVTTYFGRFPVSKVGLLIVADDSSSIRDGTTFDYDGSAIRVHVGRGADAAAFKQDWILVHEMTHLALPMKPQNTLWLQEGSATYVEPIARTQAGHLDIKSVWKWYADHMADGQPESGDGGLDTTHSHDRIYWGGAAFWLLADIRIRERTHGHMGVQTALRAIDRASSGDTADWNVREVLRTGDVSTGGTELIDLYESMGPKLMLVDIADLFAKLGVAEHDGQIVFDDSAPLAKIRRQITDPVSAKTAG